MSEIGPPTRPRRERRRRRGPHLRTILLLALLLFVFLLGIAFAETLDERPEDGDPVTDVRTLSPLEQQPPVRVVTVTETVTSP